MKLTILTGLTILIIPAACHKASQYYSARDRELTIEVTKMAHANNNAGELDFAARVIPAKSAASDIGKIRDGMLYHMDSCFYFLDNGKKIYPAITQAIANGLKDRYDYFISFGSDDVHGSPPALIYQDKFFNKRKYLLKLVKE